MKKIFILLLLFISNSFAGEAIFSDQHSWWADWDKQCHSLSLKYKKHFPTRKISALCSVQSKEAKSAEELNKINSRHLYVILAELFYSKENYERRSALTLLFSYECENAKICSEYMQVLAREIKKDFLFLHKKDPYFFKNILELKTKVQGRVKIFK